MRDNNCRLLLTKMATATFKGKSTTKPGQSVFDVGGTKVRASNKQQAEAKAASLARERQADANRAASKAIRDSLPPARGEGFAEGFEKEMTDRGLDPNDVFGRGDITQWTDYFAGQGAMPSVFSNADILDNKISRLDQQAFGLPTYGSSNFDLPEEGGGIGEEYDFDEILGLGGGKKKKKSEGTLPTKAQRDMEAYGDDPQTREMLRLIKDMQSSSDRATQDAVSAIESRFSQLRQSQEASNAQELAGVKQALNLGGSSRYAPISSAGIIGAQVATNTRRLADLESQERALVSQARQAQEANDYRLLEKKLGLLEDVRQEKLKAAESLDKSLQETQIQSTRDNAIAGLVSQGVTDPAQLLDYLNYDEKGNLVGDFTLKEVATAISYLTPKASANGSFKFDSKQVGPLLGAGFTMADIQTMQEDFNAGRSVQAILDGVPPEMQQMVMEALGVDPTKASGLRPGVGATDPLTEQMIRTRLFPKAASILNKGTLSDADREIIDERIGYFRDNGLSEQQILDVFSGWSADVSTPFNQTFRDIVLGTQETGEGVSQNLTSLGSLLASGNYKGAMNKVENVALKSVEKEPGYVGKITTENYTKKIDRIKHILKEGGVWDGTGPLEGTYQQLIGRFKGPEATRLQGELAALYTDFRKENAGTAVTEAELEFLSPLFAAITDKKGNFLVKLDTFQRSLMDGHNATRRTVSLPEVQVKDILDPNERLRLYAERVTSDNIDSADI